MKIARLLLTPDLLRELLHLPRTTEILHAGMDHQQIELTIQDPGLLDVEIGDARPPLVLPTFQAHDVVEFLGWNQP